MSIVTRVCVVAWLAAGLSACSQPKPVDMAKAEEALRCFGREEYGKVPGLLEQSGVMQSPKAPMFYFYLGECFYRTNKFVNALRYFEKAFRSIFNKDEAAFRLIGICEQLGIPEARQRYRDYIGQQLKKYDCIEPPAKWANAQPRGEGDPDEPYNVEHSISKFGSYSWGRAGLGKGFPSIAAWEFESCVVNNIPAEERFNSEWALRCYTKLAKAYRQKADLFTLNKFSLFSYDPKTVQDAARAIRKYLDENRAREIPEAEQLAEHYRLKAIVVEARLAAKKKP